MNDPLRRICSSAQEPERQIAVEVVIEPFSRKTVLCYVPICAITGTTKREVPGVLNDRPLLREVGTARCLAQMYLLALRRVLNTGKVVHEVLCGNPAAKMR